jgi:regulator of sirC expression with transglutaminase-like and TPR domain
MRLTASERDPLASELQHALSANPIDLAGVALTLAKLEYAGLDPARSIASLDRLGDRARERIARVAGGSTRARVAALNALLFDDEGFSGNYSHYDDFRNSYLNAVLERRLGIPITLALVYMEVARRARIDVQGIAFPGHFLMRVPLRGSSPDAEIAGLVLDPFDGGAELDASSCRKLLGRHLGTTDDPPLDPALLRPCTPRQMVARMLNNLKRTYLELHAFGRARRVTDLLLVVEPSGLSELRDRGLLALHLDDFAAALRDLEDYSRLRAWRDEGDQEERDQILDSIKRLRRRIGTMN